MTALMLAAEHGRADIVRMLLQAGASTEPKDGSGRTVAQIAEKSRPVLEVLNEHMKLEKLNDAYSRFDERAEKS